MFSDPYNHASVKKVTVVKDRSQEEKKNTEKKIIGRADRFTRVFLSAMLLTVSVYAVHESKFPEGTTVLSAVKSIVTSEWNEDLGRIRFVNRMFPETQSVFWQNTMPDFDIPRQNCIHTWTKDEPYLSFNTDEASALSDGMVDLIVQNSDMTYTITISHDPEYKTRYHGISRCFVSEKSGIKKHEALGTVSGQNLHIEFLREGIPFCPENGDQP